MACNEHSCDDCGFRDWDNLIWKECPQCGSKNVGNFFDEDGWWHPYDDDDDDDDGWRRVC